MSQTFSLVCHETRKQIWIGQGSGSMTALYSGEPKTMEHLKQFLNDHRGKPLEFVCDDTTEYFDYESYDQGPKAIPDRIRNKELLARIKAK